MGQNRRGRLCFDDLYLGRRAVPLLPNRLLAVPSPLETAAVIARSSCRYRLLKSLSSESTGSVLITSNNSHDGQLRVHSVSQNPYILLQLKQGIPIWIVQLRSRLHQV